MNDWKVERDHLYDMLADPGKIATKVLEAGLHIGPVKNLDQSTKRVMLDEETALYYCPDSGSGVWLAKLAREFEGEISVKTIDKYLDKLLDERILKPPVRSIDPLKHQVMEKIIDDDGAEKWVRSFYISNEHIPDMLFIYRATHRIYQVEKTGCQASIVS
jgi:hypothetical protein